eukprot:scaffold59856_cov92-Attheya_sp.AAC.2
MAERLGWSMGRLKNPEDCNKTCKDVRVHQNHPPLRLSSPTFYGHVVCASLDTRTIGHHDATHPCHNGVCSCIPPPGAADSSH